jgi:hypothetical protein
MAAHTDPPLRELCQRCFHVTVACLLALLLVGTVAPAAAEPPASPEAPLQFTSSGHVLAFTLGGVVAAAGSHAYRVEFVNAATTPVADTPVAASEGGSGPPPLTRVTYPDLWPGISLAYDALGGALLRSTYRLAPLADPDRIRLRYNAPVELESDGSLALHYTTGAMRESAPVAWQEIGGRRIPVAVTFRLIEPGAIAESRQVGFSLGDYDPAQPLTIDPSLTWHTFLGGSVTDRGWGIAVDGSGNVYVAGDSDATWGSPVRAHSGDSDAFVAKLDSGGALQWNTFLGGGGSDYGRGIAVDGSGNVYVAGSSLADWGSPIRDYSGSRDAFAVQLDSSGALQWHTFLGGSRWDIGSSIAVDESGNIHIVGYSDATWGSPVRAFNGSRSSDAFAAKLDASGALEWNTFLGGSDQDYGNAIAVDGSGNLYVTGDSHAVWESPIRTFSGGIDAFAAKLDSSGALQWNTFLGGSVTEYGYGIAVDGSGNVYLAGGSNATWGSPVRAHSGDADVFAAQLDDSGDLQWHTFLGGSRGDWANSIALDGSGNVYLAGRSYATWGTPVRAFSGDIDALAAQLDGSGALQWHTFLGGSGQDVGFSIAVDGSGDAYVAGYSRATWGTPVRDYSGALDALAAKLSPRPEIDVQGNGQSIPNGATTPSVANHTDFGTTSVASGALVRTFTISNSSSVDWLNLTGSPPITLTRGTHFSVTAQPSSPVPGHSATAFEITFAPSAVGAFTDTVHIANDDINENPYTFVISGTGTLNGICYLPMLIAPPAGAGFPVHIGDPIQRRNVRHPGETFYTASVQAPGSLPAGGRFSFSSRPDRLAPVLVDDELVVLLDGEEVFTFDFSTSGTPQPALLEVPRSIVQQIAGQAVQVEYRDIYAVYVETSEIWLIWLP